MSAAWVEEKSKPPPIEGPRHAWKRGTKVSASRHADVIFVCERCGTEKTTIRPKATTSVGGAPATPITHYRPDVFSHWTKKRPPCVCKKQTMLFAKDDRGVEDARAEVAAVVHEAVFEETPARDAAVNEKKKNSRSPTHSPKVFTLHMETLPEGVDVALEIVDDGDIFASEYQWRVFVHVEAGGPRVAVPGVRTLYASIPKIDRELEALKKFLSSDPKVWIVAERTDETKYTRAWRGSLAGGGWVFRERGESGER